MRQVQIFPFEGGNQELIFLTGELCFYCRETSYMYKYEGRFDFPFNDPFYNSHQKVGTTEPVQPV